VITGTNVFPDFYLIKECVSCVDFIRDLCNICCQR